MRTTRATKSRASRYLGQSPPLDALSPYAPSGESPLDAADLKIIEILWQDGRANNRSMTDHVGLTEETVAARIRNMIERNIIGITTVFDWKAAGYQIDLWLRIECHGDLKRVVEGLLEIDEIVRLWTVLGSADLVAEVMLPDMEAASEFLTSTIRGVEGIQRVDVSLALEILKSFYQFTNIPVRFDRLKFPNPVVQPDELDWRILEALATSGRDSNREIARRLGVSDGTVRTRIGRLESSGLVRVCAQVDPRNSGMLRDQSLLFIAVHGRNVRRVAGDLAAIPEVGAVNLMMGREALLLFVTAATREAVISAITGPIRSTPGVKAIDVYEIVDTHRRSGQWARWWTPRHRSGVRTDKTTHS